jgi:hypothetical protein
MSTENATFDQGAIVEIMGRQVIAGRVTEQTIGGTAFIRVDVPECGDQPAFTRFYGAGAIYAMTPVSEEAARIALRRFRPEPVTVYVPELKQLVAPAPADPVDEPDHDIDEDDEWEYYDPSEDDDEPPF